MSAWTRLRGWFGPSGRDMIRRSEFDTLASEAPIRSGGGVFVTSENARGIPAVNAAVRIASQSVARLELKVYSGKDADKEPRPSSWQARLLAAPSPVQDRFQFLEAIEESLSFRGNAFVWRNIDPSLGRPVELLCLHPDQVSMTSDSRGRLVYRVRVGGSFLDPVGKGHGTVEVGEQFILHLKGPGGAAMAMAPSPIELHRDAIGSSLAKIRHERNTFDRGTSIPLAITFPEQMTAEQADQWRQLWQRSHGGASNAGKTAVLGGGATITPIGMTQVDAQFVASANLSVEEIARIFGVQPSLLGVMGSDRPLSPEHEEDRWLRYGLGPRLRRIEDAFRADPWLFPRADRIYPEFDASTTIRGDLKTESAIAVSEVQAGIITPNEARRRRGLPPIEGGDELQITPVGGAPNPNAAGPAAPSDNDEEESDGDSPTD